MPAAFDTMKWPATPSVAAEIKEVLAEFFCLADLKDTTAGKPMSENIFAEDGPFTRRMSHSLGRKIAGSRTHAWDTVTFRKHTIQRVYVGDVPGRDIIVTGIAELRPKDGVPTVQEFAARAVFEAERDGKLKMKMYKAWGGVSIS